MLQNPLARLCHFVLLTFQSDGTMGICRRMDLLPKVRVRRREAAVLCDSQLHTVLAFQVPFVCGGEGEGEGEGESNYLIWLCKVTKFPEFSTVQFFVTAIKKLDTISCSPASVGLAQARPNKLHGWWEGLGMRLHVSYTDQHLRGKEEGEGNIGERDGGKDWGIAGQIGGRVEGIEVSFSPQPNQRCTKLYSACINFNIFTKLELFLL